MRKCGYILLTREVNTFVDLEASWLEDSAFLLFGILRREYMMAVICHPPSPVQPVLSCLTLVSFIEASVKCKYWDEHVHKFYCA